MGLSHPGRHRRVIIRLVLGTFGVCVALIGWLVAFDRSNSAVPVLPDTQPKFSLDLQVIGSMQHGVVYAVEQRARPAYRVLSFDPATGAVTTVFTVPEKAIIYGMIALSHDRKTLAVAYSPNFHVAGSGLWMLDLRTRALTRITPARPGRYLTDPVWSADDTSVLGSYVDRNHQTEQLSVAQVGLADKALRIVIDDGVTPAVIGFDIYYLADDSGNARQAVGRVDSRGTISTIPVGGGKFDLDHLLPGTTPRSLRVAVLDNGRTASGGPTLGAPAGAHGNHGVPSAW